MADVSNDRLILHATQVLSREDVKIAGCGDEDVCALDNGLELPNRISLHCRLQRTNRIDLGNHHTGTLSAQRLRAALANFTETANNGNLSANHDIGSTVEAINHRVPATIDIVEF